MSALPPCAGQWELFDSTDPSDHEEAKALCGQCPMIVECGQRLDAARNRAHRGGGQTYGPVGTWAGRLMGIPRTTAARMAAEDAMFTEAELRAAHAAFATGDRRPITKTAERIYQRNRKRRKVQERAA